MVAPARRHLLELRGFMLELARTNDLGADARDRLEYECEHLERLALNQERQLVLPFPTEKPASVRP